MAGSGRKTFSPGDVLTSSDVQNYLMDQSVMVFAGTAARASAIPSPSAGMVAYSTATSLQVYNGSAWVATSTGYGVASGTAASSTAITVAGTAYTLLAFTSTSNLVVSSAGLFDVMLVASGGGGGSNSTAGNINGGGGGAGGLITSTIYLSAGTYSVGIGAGGANETNGNDTTIGSVTVGSTVAPIAIGGGGGLSTTANTGQSTYGGSAGAPRSDQVPATKKVVGQGNNSGDGVRALGGNNGAAGGGGAGAVGGDGSALVGGVGGIGFDASTFRGQVANSTLYSGGGGGQRQSGSSGAGGLGGGGAGSNAGTGTNGTANTGGGAGGGVTGGQGGSGIALIRFKV